MSYFKFLKSKNLSQNTITIYSFYLKKWQNFIDDAQPNKTLVLKYIKLFKKKSPNTIRLAFASLMSYFKYLKLNKLYNICLNIKLPIAGIKFKNVIDLDDFHLQKKTIITNKWCQKRNWLIFVFCFSTGIRISEIYQINKKAIQNNKIMIVGKGNKTRMVFIPKYTQKLLNEWNYDFIAIKSNQKYLSYKQLNKIIKNIGNVIFNNQITPHDLRRSYATNLLRKGVDIKTVSELLGHNNINTTSRYIHLSENEIINKIQDIFD